MLHTNLIIMAGVILGSAFLQPARPTRSAKRSSTTRRARSVPEFSGKRSRSGKALPAKLRRRLPGPGATPTPLPGPAGLGANPTPLPGPTSPGASATPLPGPAPANPSMPGGHAKRKGPASTITPTVPAHQDPDEFVFVAPDRLGHVMGPLRVESGTINGWSRKGISVRGNDSVTLRVATPPAGKVAYVRCGVTFGFKHRWKKAVLAATVGGVTKIQPIPKTGGILEFEVFPGGDSRLATLRRDASTQADKKLWWTITGCDRTVR